MAAAAPTGIEYHHTEAAAAAAAGGGEEPFGPSQLFLAPHLFFSLSFLLYKPVLRPRDLVGWEHPTIDVVAERYRLARPLAFRQITWNLVALAVLYFASYSSILKILEDALTRVSLSPLVLWASGEPNFPP